MSDRIHNSDGEVKVAIVGKYTQLEDAYKSIAEALTHGGMANRVRVKVEWVDAELFDKQDPAPHLEGFHAILVRVVLVSVVTEGKIKAAEFARTRKVPYLGICLGMQMAVIEAARNVAGLKTAGSEEFDHESGKKRFEPVVYHLKDGYREITRLSVRLAMTRAALCAWAHMMLNYWKEAMLQVFMAKFQLMNGHRHRYEVDIKYREQLEKAGLCFSGMSPDGRLPEIVEWSNHPWFIGVQFHPELKSKPLRHTLYLKTLYGLQLKQVG